MKTFREFIEESRSGAMDPNSLMAQKLAELKKSQGVNSVVIRREERLKRKKAQQQQGTEKPSSENL